MAILLKDLKLSFPSNIDENLLNYVFEEYLSIKKEYLLGHWRPNELSGGRFAEGVIRIMQSLNGELATPLGQSLNTETILNRLTNSQSLTPSIRLFITKLCRILLDIRNRRDVAHLGGEVNPNESDSKFVVSCADWILAELVRHNYVCSLDEAQRIVNDIVEYKLPLIADIDGFIRVQNVDLDIKDKILVILAYQKNRSSTDKNLAKWLEYQNQSRFNGAILKDLHQRALIHYQGNKVTILPKGLIKIEQDIDLSI